MTASLALAPAFADAPPVAAPRTPVTVQQLPPVQQAAPMAAKPASPPQQVAAPAERPVWQQPYLYAWIALADTLAASAATFLYLRKPSKGVIQLAAALTASSAIFVAAAIAAWIF